MGKNGVGKAPGERVVYKKENNKNGTKRIVRNLGGKTYGNCGNWCGIY